MASIVHPDAIMHISVETVYFFKIELLFSGEGLHGYIPLGADCAVT